MKKLTALFLLIAVLMTCTTSCKKVENTPSDIVIADQDPQNNVENNNADIEKISDDNNDNVKIKNTETDNLYMPPPKGYNREHFYSKTDFINWMNQKGFRNNSFGKSRYGEVFSGRRNFYFAYRNGKEIKTTRYICSYDEADGYTTSLWLLLEEDFLNAGYAQVVMILLNDRIRGENDPTKVLKDFWPNSDESEFNRKSVEFIGNNIEMIWFISNDMFYHYFVYEDVLVKVLLYSKDDSIEEFLDGFELRPIDLSAEKIPTE